MVAQWRQRREERGIGDTNRKIVRDNRLSREKSRDARNLKLSEIVIWLYRIERIVGIRDACARERNMQLEEDLEVLSYARKLEGCDFMHVHVQRWFWGFAKRKYARRSRWPRTFKGWICFLDIWNTIVGSDGFDRCFWLKDYGNY